MNERPPDVLVIVLDCVRASDFWNGGEETDYLPETAALARHSVQYKRAVAPAPWTVPSHASLFTGLYPWEHGAHIKGENSLSSDRPTLPRVLKEHGYATLSASANFLVSPFFGLASDFDRAFWGGWWEPFLRFPPRPGREPPPHRRGRPNPVLHRMRSGSFWPIFEASTSKLSEYTALLDLSVRFSRKILNPEDDGYPQTSPWIEPEVHRWLTLQPKERPVFCFVNLLDAHEPYFASKRVIRNFSEWRKYASQRQDRQGWIRGTWRSSREDLALLHSLYRESIRAVDRRIGNLLRLFQEHDRWDNTLVVVTADHGQSFGEHGVLYHMLRVDEELVRVPLLVRYPGNKAGGTHSESWASLVDVAPTVLEVAGLPGAMSTSGLSLTRLAHEPRPGPVFSISDGLGQTQGKSMTRSVRKKLDRIYAAAYQENLKVVVDSSAPSRPRMFELEDDWATKSLPWNPDLPGAALLKEAAETAIRSLLRKEALPLPATVDERLRAWGYL